MADIERGTRIRERREALHLTQPAVVELLEQAAYRLPRTHELHPDQAGKAPVTLRGFQSYEAGGGIVWEKAKLLAQVLQCDVQAMMSGGAEGSTPDLSRREPDYDERISRMEQLIERQNELLERQSLLLERIEARLEATVEQEARTVDRIEAATDSLTGLGGSAADLDAAVRRTIGELRSAPRPKAPKARKPAAKRTPQA